MLSHPMVIRETSDGTLLAPPICGLVTVPDLVSHVTAWCARPDARHDLVLDLSSVAVLEPAALSAVLWASRYCAARGKRLTVQPAIPGVLTTDEDVALRRTCHVGPADAGGRAGVADPLGGVETKASARQATEG
jgi:hypothetical protein